MAAEYQLTSQGVTYVYQAGIDPQRLANEPGHLITAARSNERLSKAGGPSISSAATNPTRPISAPWHDRCSIANRAQPHALSAAEQPLVGRPPREALAEFDATWPFEPYGGVDQSAGRCRRKFPA